LFWVKSLFFEAQPEPAKDESADRIIDLNEISVLVGGDREVYRLTRDRGALPVGKEIDGRTYWRESDILRWIGRVRREVPKRTYGEEDYWDFDDLARYLNRSRDQIFELVAKGDFPAGVQVGDQLCWSKADVRQWFAGLQLDTLDSLKKSRWKEAIMEIRRVYKAPRGTT
jgi:predicted DNA-binding transcriptional regulator AlpA